MHTSSEVRVSALMACHNRRDTTLDNLRLLYSSVPNNWKLKLFLVDDGSSDGTSIAVSNFDPNITVIYGPGNWFWARSMYEAQKIAHEVGGFDYLLWINDDVEIFEEGLSQFETERSKHPRAVIVGQFATSICPKISYGGYKRNSRHPLKLRRIHAKDTCESADTFNGNLVLIPKLISDRVGLIDGKFEHGYADLDYGYRVCNLGFKILVVPGFVGNCDFPQFEIDLNPLKRVVHAFSKKKSPLRSHVRFLRKYAHFEWPILLVFHYLRVFFLKSSEN